MNTQEKEKVQKKTQISFCKKKTQKFHKSTTISMYMHTEKRCKT
jgi:hypothetical protein